MIICYSSSRKLVNSLSILIRVLQKIRSNRADICTQRDLLWGIGLCDYKVEKSRDLSSTSWRPRKASGIGLVQVQRPKSLRDDGASSQSEGRRWMFQPNQSGKKRGFFFPPFFCSIQALNGLDGAHSHWRGQSALLGLLIQIQVSSRNTLTDTPRSKFNQISGHPMIQSSWYKINHQTKSSCPPSAIATATVSPACSKCSVSVRKWY